MASNISTVSFSGLKAPTFLERGLADFAFPDSVERALSSLRVVASDLLALFERRAAAVAVKAPQAIAEINTRGKSALRVQSFKLISFPPRLFVP
jgi:hypothetical protein